jgi:ABC-2 type transport system ATP-binding protein
MTDRVAVKIEHLTKRFASEESVKIQSKPALENLSAVIKTGHITGLVGPDGAGKTTLIRLIGGLMTPSEGRVEVFGLDSVRHAAEIQQGISYMPQRFGLYEDLSVEENLRLYSDLHNVTGKEREQQFARLLEFTDLKRFSDRLAGNLSGGMKQKLGLACSLIEKPRLLLLDEPSVGVDPISRRELWQLVNDLIDDSMAVVWSTAYLDEAEKCETVLLLNEGQLLFDGPPSELTSRVQERTFVIQNLSGSKRQVLTEALETPQVLDGVIQGRNVRIVTAKSNETPDLSHSHFAQQAEIIATPPRFEDAFIDILGGGPSGHSQLAENMPTIYQNNRQDGMQNDQHTGPNQSRETLVEAIHLTKRFGNFIAANDINFAIQSGEIFGLLGPNGAGKSTTFKMMCGLLKPTEGTAKVVGLNLQTASSKARSRIGYMAQKFSLYGNLSVLQNLDFFSGVYGLGGKTRNEAIDRMIHTFNLQPYLNANSGGLPLGYKQRLALACAVMHNPHVLFLDEPTSGVDPITRREFWTHINGLVEKGVTVMVTTHFMDEAEYCDRIALVYRGKVIALGEPDQLRQQAATEQLPNPTMEDTFIQLIQAFDAAHKNDDPEAVA